MGLRRGLGGRGGRAANCGSPGAGKMRVGLGANTGGGGGGGEGEGLGAGTGTGTGAGFGTGSGVGLGAGAGLPWSVPWPGPRLPFGDGVGDLCPCALGLSATTTISRDRNTAMMAPPRA